MVERGEVCGTFCCVCEDLWLVESNSIRLVSFCLFALVSVVYNIGICGVERGVALCVR